MVAVGLLAALGPARRGLRVDPIEALWLTHMAKLGVDRYYKRSGDSFLKMEHFEVADMFGRRQRPDLQVVVGQPDVARVMVSIRNNGRGMARAPYLGLRVLPQGSWTVV